MFKNTSKRVAKWLAAGSMAIAGLMAVGAAQAHGGVSWSVGVGVPGVAVGVGAPVYMPPRPVYYAPPPAVYYAPPPPAYYAPPRPMYRPAPVYYQGGPRWSGHGYRDHRPHGHRHHGYRGHGGHGGHGHRR